MIRRAGEGQAPETKRVSIVVSPLRLRLLQDPHRGGAEKNGARQSVRPSTAASEPVAQLRLPRPESPSAGAINSPGSEGAVGGSVGCRSETETAKASLGRGQSFAPGCRSLGGNGHRAFVGAIGQQPEYPVLPPWKPELAVRSAAPSRPEAAAVSPIGADRVIAEARPGMWGGLAIGRLIAGH